MRLVIAGLALAIISALLLFLAGPGYRLDIWGYSMGFELMRYAAYGGLAAAGICILGLVLAGGGSRKTFLLGLLGIGIGGAASGIPYYWVERARAVPPINDITTDTENPPEFLAILPLRADAPNPPEYGGPEFAEQQLEAYPEVSPLLLSDPPEVAFDQALETARSMGWEIIAAEKSELRIEATATTGWFGFTDDVVVRLKPYAVGTQVDVRSKSRVGRSDIGTNAKRIMKYLALLEERDTS